MAYSIQNHLVLLLPNPSPRMPTKIRGMELRLELEMEKSELVRAFVRESSLAEHVSPGTASRMADGTITLWKELCRHHRSGARVRLAALVKNNEIMVRASITGHDKLVPFMPSLFAGLPKDLGFSYRESGIDGWEVTLHTSLESPSSSETFAYEDGDGLQATESFRIEPPREEDAPAIARCFLQVYGRHYIHSEVFSPRRYWSKVRSGELIPIIARNSAGEVVGHVALERDAGAQIAERGQAVVLPSCRGQHLLEQMSEQLTDQARQIGLVGIFAQPVTVHMFSQRNDDHAGMPICAAMLGIRPENALPKDLPVPTRGQRQSLLLAYRFLDAPGERLFYAPAAYRGMISKISEKIGIRPIFSGDSGSLEQNSAIHVKLDKNGAAHIEIEKIGVEIGSELKLTVTNLTSLGAEYVQLAAPLSDPGMSLLIEAAQSLGFYFCGMGPAFFISGDALLLQFAVQPIDASKLQLFTEHAKALVSFIEEDRRMVSR